MARGDHAVTKPLTLRELAKATRRMPAAMWYAQADASEASFRRIWKRFKSSAVVKRSGRGTPLLRPSKWPFLIDWAPKPSRKNVDLNRFTARFGTLSEAGPVLEFGGYTRPRKGKYLSIPLRGARTKTGKVKLGYSSPSEAIKRGKRFVRLERDGNIYLHELVSRRKAGLPTRGPRGGKSKRINPVPAYLLKTKVLNRGLLGFHETALRTARDADDLYRKVLAKRIREALANRGRIESLREKIRKGNP